MEDCSPTREPWRTSQKRSGVSRGLSVSSPHPFLFFVSARRVISHGLRPIFNYARFRGVTPATHLINLDGVRADLAKNFPVSPLFQVIHSFSLASQTLPPTYNYSRTTRSVTFQCNSRAWLAQPQMLLTGNVDGEDNVNGRLNHGWTPMSVTTHGRVQLSRNESINFKALDPSPTDFGGMYFASCLQSATKNMAVISESPHQRANGMTNTSTSYLVEYTGSRKGWIAATQL